MNMDKVNATLGKALLHVQEGEMADLRAGQQIDESGDAPEFIQSYVESLVKTVVKTGKVTEDEAREAVIEAMAELAGKEVVKTEADLNAWAGRVKLGEAIARRLA